ncbi:hypothetical protein Goarm_022635 [Gossypium armourianum]|uniref:CCHC-type domain-containing protein n=1 Tax=Gossypium armourianum TaxID=34283 RepID=A0A7J9KGX3_9ROSI|nr:hypothetical protein [Gossypium armourianum]
MVVESSPTPSLSSKDMLVGKDTFVQNNTNGGQFLVDNLSLIEAQGHYARMEDYVNLGRLLVSKILINGSPQRIEYENLLVVCFKWGCYGHIKENCRSVTYCSEAKEKGKTLEQTSSTSMVAEDGDYGP